MKKKYIYALGFFDGVHRGHQVLLAHSVRLAQETGLGSGAVTFDSHPQRLTRGNSPELITTVRDREKLLYNFVDRVVILHFGPKLRSLPWEAYLETLINEFDAGGFVCGDDFRFGHLGKGNAKILEQYCREHDMPFHLVTEQAMDGVRVSSTYIRGLLRAGRVREAHRFLGHPYCITGIVVPGNQLGRRLGTPTANLSQPAGVVQMRHGVYACRCHVDGQVYTAVTNIGTRPTVNGDHVTVEPWILDWEGDLYGKEITLEFVAFLRPELRFKTLEDLKTKIHQDADKARKMVEG